MDRKTVVILMSSLTFLTITSGCGSPEAPEKPIVEIDTRDDAGSNGDEESMQNDAEDVSMCATLDRACDTEGETRCTPDGVETCEPADDGCLTWGDPKACEDGTRCVAGDCVSCRGETGTYRRQTIMQDDEDRFYLLHVPAGYSCENAAPVLVDFHGTAGASVPAEEAYGTQDLLDLADREGFILIRPRSRSRVTDDFETFQWDINPGDLERNVELTLDLLDHVAADYHIDVSRIYAAGFSNGTNMALQFLWREDNPFSGFGLVGGGIWWNLGSLPQLESHPAIYMSTGYRDYMHSTQRALLDLLERSAYPDDRVRVREFDGGHELYAWHFDEIWSWLTRSEAPAGDTLTSGWLQHADAPPVSLLELAQTADGDLVAVGEQQAIWRYEIDNARWVEVYPAAGTDAPMWTDLCLLASGRGYAVGGQALAMTEDHGESWSFLSPAPEFFGTWFGDSYLQAVACTEERTVAGGYWTGVTSPDPLGGDWEGAAMSFSGYPAQIATLALGGDGSMVAAGNYYVGRSLGAPYREFVQSTSLVSGWLYDADEADGTWWMVGAEGRIYVSTDGGRSWIAQRPAKSGPDLYAVDFLDATTGIAVGANGQALLTRDAGANWEDVSLGVDRFLGDVMFLRDDTVLAVGERGLVVEADLDELTGR